MDRLKDRLKLFPRLMACALSEMHQAIRHDDDRFVCAYHVYRVYDLLKAVERREDRARALINYDVDYDSIGPEGTVVVNDPDKDDYDAIMSSNEDEVEDDDVEDDDAEVDSAIPKSRSNVT